MNRRGFIQALLATPIVFAVLPSLQSYNYSKFAPDPDSTELLRKALTATQPMQEGLIPESLDSSIDNPLGWIEEEEIKDLKTLFKMMR